MACVDERIDATHLLGVRAARAHARARAWAAGAAPDHRGWLYLDVDATICLDHSDNKENAAATWKKTFGFHPLLVFLDRPDIAAGEALAGLLRKGNAGSNTTADHITVLGQALESLPAAYRPDPDNPDAPQVLIRSDSAGATHGFAAACRTAQVGFSLGAVIDSRVQNAVEILNAANAWYPAIDTDGGIRDGACVAEATRSGGSVGLAARYPAGAAQRTATSRRAVAVHRLRRAPGHRVSHRHRRRCDRGAARRPGTTAPPTRPGGRPHPLSQSHRPA